jgi:hypothetical protein
MMGHIVTDETRNKLSKSLQGKNLGIKRTKEFCDNISKRGKGKPHTREHSEAISKAKMGHGVSEATRKKISEANKGRIISEETRQKLIGRPASNKGIPPSEETKQKLRKANLGKKATNETKEKISNASKRNWESLEYADKLRKAWHISPNKAESKLLDLLNELFPGHYKYTGDFSFIINGKNPDFVNINGQKKLIELFGDYWHKGEDPQDRINIFKPYGWNTLIVWEKELNDLPTLVETLINFHEGDVE